MSTKMENTEAIENSAKLLVEILKKESQNFPKLTQEEKDRVNEEYRYFKKYPSLLNDALTFFSLREKIGKGKINKPNSIIFYFLGITEAKPDLSRWMSFGYELDKDSSRQSPPDIDIDFEQRDAILNYLCDKYGKEHVALIGTSIAYKPKAAIQMAAKALDITRTQRDGDRRFSPENDKEAKRISKIIPNIAGDISVSQWIGEDPKFKPPTNVLADVMKALKPEVAKYPEVFQHAKNLQGIIKSYGTHAAGVVISRDPLVQDVPLHYTKMIKDPDASEELEGLMGDNYETLVRLPTTQYNMEEVEELGLLKFDFLQLENLRQISLVKKLVKKSNYKGKSDLTLVEDGKYSVYPYEDKNVCIDNLETNDPNVFRTIKDLKLEGIFQLAGGVFRSGNFHERNWNTGEYLFNPDGTPRMKYKKGLIEVIGCDSFEDIVVANAIGRPGPLKSRVHYEYISGKRRPDSVSYPHHKLKDILGTTFGVLCYQEQLIKMSMVLAGFTFAQADKLRKACAKKKRELLDDIEPKFREGCKKNNIDQSVIDSMWDIAIKFGEYAFNRSLSFSEGIMTNNGVYTIGKLYDMKQNNEDLPMVYSSNGDEIEIIDVYDHGKLPMWKVVFDDDSEVTCSINHKFETNIGIIPLSKIIESEACIIQNRSILQDEKRIGMSGMFCDAGIKGRVEVSQKRMCGMEKNKERNKQEKQLKSFRKISRSIRKRKMDSETIGFYNSILSRKQERKEKKIFINEEIKQKILRFFSKKQNRNSHSNFIEGGYFGKKIKAIGSLAGRKSREIFQSMYKTINCFDWNLAFSSGKGIEENSNSSWVQVQPNCQRKEFRDKNKKKTDRFYESREENNSGVRWATTFQKEKFWSGEPRKEHKERQQPKQSNDVKRLFGDKNVFRYMVAKFEKIQIFTTRKGVERNNELGFSEEKKWENNKNRSCLRKIKKIEFAGIIQSYDLEVRSEDHLYCLASGIVNSNSHSAAYGLIAYQTAFLKTYFTSEFISAVLSSAVSNEEKLKDLEKSFKEEYPKLEILSAEINLSKDTFFPSGYLTIAAPFCSIKGLGDKVSVALVEKQPYASVYDFAMKHPALGDSVIDLLIGLDVFRNFGSKEEVSQEFKNVQTIKKRVLKNASTTIKSPKSIDLF